MATKLRVLSIWSCHPFKGLILWRKLAAGLTYVKSLKMRFPSPFGLAAGESTSGMSVHFFSKLAVQSFPETSGRKLGWTCLASSFFQLMGLNHLCRFTSSLPAGLLPSRLCGSFCRSCSTKSFTQLFNKYRTRTDTSLTPANSAQSKLGQEQLD